MQRKTKLIDEGIVWFGKKGMAIIAGALFVGFCIGYGLNYNSKDLPKESKYNINILLEKLKYGIATEGLKKCKIVSSNVALRSEPSVIHGTTLCNINYGAEVEFIEVVPSGDMDPTYAEAAYDFEISQLLHRNIKVTKGTPMHIVNDNGSSYTCNFSVEGKNYTKRISPSQLLRAYTGEWKRVKIYNQVGFIKTVEASEPKYM